MKLSILKENENETIKTKYPNALAIFAGKLEKENYDISLKLTKYK